ncbi:condensation domain-containing protein [Lysinibacillus sp. NPDC058147]|uniref:condensation domain-containing protein n=1 Tax=unclassified Lysinibacillus TaxID=2636778 RepID=UPI0036D8C89D
MNQKNSIGIEERSHHLFTLSAKSQKALQNAVMNLGRHLDLEPKQNLGDLAFTLHVGRVTFDHCLTIVAENKERLKEICHQLGNSSTSDFQYYANYGQKMNKKHKIVFLFSGQGSHYSGMGYELYKSSPFIREIFEECFDILKPYYPIHFSEYMFNSDYKSNLDHINISSLAMFIVEYALAKSWISWGVRPDYVIGHSLGEYTAACIAGGLSLKDALLMLVKRGYLMEEKTESGALLSVNSPLEIINNYLLQYNSELTIATINGPQQFVIGGKRPLIEELKQQLENDGIINKLLPISTASHSILMEPILDTYHKYMNDNITFTPLQIPLVSNLTGNIMMNQVLDADYWCKHLRETVHFASGIETLISEEMDIFLEIGPHPVLKTFVESMVTDDSQIILSSMNRKEPAWKTVQESLGKIWSTGVIVNWREFDKQFARKRVHAPTYSFDLVSCWSNCDQASMFSREGGSTNNQADNNDKKNSNRITTVSVDSKTTEEWLKIIWREVLGVENVSFDNDFLQLGGESLHLIQVQSRIRKIFKVTIHLKDLFKNTRFKDLTEHINMLLKQSEKDSTQSNSISNTNTFTSGNVPISHIQKMAFGMSEYDPEFFFLPICLQTSKQINPNLLQKTIEILHKHHDMLRATYLNKDNEFIQVIKPSENIKINFEQYDLTAYKNEEEKKTAFKDIQLSLAKKTKFTNGLMNRAALIRWEHNTYKVLWIVSHLYSDNISNRILQQDLIETYELLEKGLEPNFDKGTTYKEWVENCRDFIKSEKVSSARGYWANTLNEISGYRINVDKSSCSNTYKDIKTVSLTLSREVTRSLRTSLTTFYKTNLKEILFTFVSRSLAKWLRKEKVIFSVNGHGRDLLDSDLDLSRTIGYFVNNFPFVVEVTEEESFGTTNNLIKNHLNSMPHRGNSFNILRYLDENQDSREAFHNYQTPEILLNYHGVLDNDINEWTDWHPVKTTFLEQPITREVPYKLIILSYIKDGQLSLYFNYAGNYFDDTSINRLKNTFYKEINTVTRGLVNLQTT